MLWPDGCANTRQSSTVIVDCTATILLVYGKLSEKTLKIKLSEQSGFPLEFDPDTMEVLTGDEIRFQQETRYRWQMDKVLKQPDALPEDAAIYWNFKLYNAGLNDSIFKRRHMTFGLVSLPSLRIGVEYIKTHGHYHAPMPGTSICYSEVYTHYYGKLYLYMQRRSHDAPDHLDDCVLYEMAPGRSILIPPGYAHILINPSDQPALMGGLYSSDAEHLYAPIQDMGGAAYQLVFEDGQERFIPNSRYATRPELRLMTDLNHTRFSPPNGNHPLWSSFVEDPQLFAFIYDPEVASSFFITEAQ
jgi:glucose-6-phosphate isomerase, archaeal